MLLLTTKTVYAIVRHMRYSCLQCNHDWNSRGTTPSRQCPSCWRRCIASEDELRLGGVVAEALSQLQRGYPPPIPTPEAVVNFPFSLTNFVAVISRADNQLERRRAVELMLIQRGVSASDASRSASLLYP